MQRAAAYGILRHCSPRLYARAKKILKSRFAEELGICVPRRINDRIVWTVPRATGMPAPEEHIVRWVSEIVQEGGTLFDVGAHCGFISIAACHRVGRNGRVIAFEPSPVLSEVLGRHKRANRLSQLQIVTKAVSNGSADRVPFFLVNGGLSFRNSLTIGDDNTPYIAKNQKTRCDVAAVTLDRFAEDSGIAPDLIKIDVEGAELRVLQGTERVLGNFRPQLIVGVHPYWLPQSDTVEEIFRLLERHGYEVKDAHIELFDDTYLADYWCIPR